MTRLDYNKIVINIFIYWHIIIILYIIIIQDYSLSFHYLFQEKLLQASSISSADRPKTIALYVCFGGGGNAKSMY